MIVRLGQETNKLADELAAYYRSGNDVPVTQANIPVELAMRIIVELRRVG